MQETSHSSARPSAVACLPCRSRHLKCDARMPVCTRCQTTGTECLYVRSKRGLRKHTRNENQSLSGNACIDWLDATALPPDLAIDADSLFQPINPFLPDDTLAVSETVNPGVAYDPMIQLYYQNFHPSHPVVIPRKDLNSSLCYLIPPYLLSIMRYIGAHYYPDPPLKQTFRHAAYSSLSDPTLRDGFQVQALLLLAIVDHSHCHEQNAHRLIQTAVNLALEIGLHHPSFASEHSYGHSVLEESWRRTYWELYVVDGLLSAMREQSPFRLYHHVAKVQLPCAEKMYNSASILPTEQTLDDLQNNWTPGQDISSFAHRINAVQNLGTVLALNRSLERSPESHIETIDAHITSSLMSLPPLHGDGYDSSTHDEMIFQAQMILYLALIYLHHPQSNMRFASFHTHHPPSTSCTRLTNTPKETTLTTTHTLDLDLDLHSHKLIRAADLLSSLATLPSTIRSRSPFFTCALGICIIVHTAALLVVQGSGREESLKARIQLGIGALRALGRIWPLSRVVRQQMVDMYLEVGRG
ncbi:hypothetical protein BDW59DRAFT_180846 [Aspergillus cavernicola]|uniref:Zn(2)-C6 fungal-type domain-containing protein n=1 Tax=Aspergillus cavernicola TaxID=176166 RepID=A0ABR4I4K0_9EURO